MEFFIKSIFEESDLEKAHKYFLRFGKGNYRKRFLMGFNKSKKIKVKASFELANEFVEFVKENKDVEFSGKVLMKEAIPGKTGRKKAGSFVYEISESSIDEFENAYFYLLDVNNEDIVLKIKKSIPKPGKSEEKIDNNFCALTLDEKYFNKLKEEFFWDVPEGKKVSVEHEVVITEIVKPENEEDPKKIRELAKRKGKLIRKINVDGKEIVKEVALEV